LPFGRLKTGFRFARNDISGEWICFFAPLPPTPKFWGLGKVKISPLIVEYLAFEYKKAQAAESLAVRFLLCSMSIAASQIVQ